VDRDQGQGLRPLETTALDTISAVWLKDKARAVVVDDVSQFRYDARDLHGFLEVQSSSVIGSRVR
jgi:hypothetical protein